MTSVRTRALPRTDILDAAVRQGRVARQLQEAAEQADRRGGSEDDVAVAEEDGSDDEHSEASDAEEAAAEQPAEREGAAAAATQVAPQPAARRRSGAELLLPREAPAPPTPEPRQEPPQLHPITEMQARVGCPVVVPGELWPSFTCDELGGAGWEAVVVKQLRAGIGVVVQWTHLTTRNGKPWQAQLQVSALRSLAPSPPAGAEAATEQQQQLPQATPRQQQQPRAAERRQAHARMALSEPKACSEPRGEREPQFEPHFERPATRASGASQRGTERRRSKRSADAVVHAAPRHARTRGEAGACSDASLSQARPGRQASRPSVER